MGLQEFTARTEEEQLQYQCYYGVCVADRETDEALVLLYQIADFYVEIYHHRWNFQIIKLFSFESDDVLDVYLDKVNVSALLENAIH